MSERKDVCPHCGYCPTCGRFNHPLRYGFPQTTGPQWPLWYPTWGESIVTTECERTGYTTNVDNAIVSDTNWKI